MGQSKVSSIVEQIKSSHSSGEALPLATHYDRDWYEVEKRNVFYDDWVFLCAEQELADPGEYLAQTIADEPIVVIRGKDGQLRAMSNVCRHRASPLLDEGFGSVKSRVVCPFHAWTYDLEGNLFGVPHPGNVEIDKSEHCLPKFKLDSWHGLLFINISGTAPPLSEKLAGLYEFLEKHEVNVAQWTKAYRGYQPGVWNANWKLAFEISAEGYHHFGVHPETAEPTNKTKTWKALEGNANWSALTSIAEYPDVPVRDQILVSITPNMAALLTPERFDWQVVFPVGPERTSVRMAGMTHEEDMRDATDEWLGFTVPVFDEDREFCERSHAAVRSEYGKGGQLVQMEQTLKHFHDYLLERVTD